jgi:hypothetical protein
MKASTPSGQLAMLVIAAAATLACSELAGASTARYTQRGDTANGVWSSNDACVYRSVYIYAGKNVNISPDKSITNYVNISISVQNICTGDFDFGNQVDGTGAILALQGATSATLKGVVALSMSHSNFYTGSYNQYTTNAIINVSFAATSGPTRTRSETSTIAPGVVVTNRISGTLAYAIGTGSISLDDGTQLINGDSASASIGQSDNATLSIVRP